MFLCAKGHVVAAGQPMVKVILETREREYVNQTRNEFGNPGPPKVSVGWEIVREGCFCAAHAVEVAFGN